MNRKIVKLIALICALVLTLAACGSKTPAATEAPATDTPATEAPAVETAAKAETAEAAVEGLTIPLSGLTEEPLFVDWNQDGTAMQLIALVGAAGASQLAFNTCQVLRT